MDTKLGGKMKTKLLKGCILLLLLITALAIAAPLRAELLVRGSDALGNKLIYDTDLDITWYDFTNSYGNWYDQKSWAETLIVEFNGTSYDDWRLPKGLLTYEDFSGFYYNTNIELGHLYYTELGNPVFDHPIENNPDLNFGVFDNLVDYIYWDSLKDYTWFTYREEDVGGYCSLATGQHWITPVDDLFHAIAVRDGNVAAAPLPGAVWLLGSGLSGIVGFRGKKK